MTLPSYPPTVFTREGGVSEMTCGGRTLELPSGRWNPRLLFVHERLAGYQFTPRSAYGALRRIAVEKFGEPTESSVARYTMKTGATITGEVLTWRWPSGGVAQLSERFTKIDDSLLMVYTAAYTEATGRRHEEAIEKAKKAF